MAYWKYVICTLKLWNTCTPLRGSNLTTIYANVLFFLLSHFKMQGICNFMRKSCKAVKMICNIWNGFRLERLRSVAFTAWRWMLNICLFEENQTVITPVGKCFPLTGFIYIGEILQIFWSTDHITPVHERICIDISISQTDAVALTSACYTISKDTKKSISKKKMSAVILTLCGYLW